MSALFVLGLIAGCASPSASSDEPGGGGQEASDGKADDQQKKPVEDPVFQPVGPAPTIERFVDDSTLDKSTSLVLGLDGFEMGDAQFVDITASIGDTKLAKVNVPAGYLPFELPVWAPKDAKDAKVTFELHTCAALINCTAGFANARFVPGQAKLVRTRFALTCDPASCSATAGCADAGLACNDGDTAVTGLPDYDPHWKDDTCASAGPPGLEIGAGNGPFAPVADGATVAAERGPQGGAHVWLAVRQTGLARSAATVIVRARQPGGLEALPTGFRMPFDVKCMHSGIRFQLIDANDHGFQPFLGKPLDVVVEVTDASGKKASATKHLVIGP